ncbi:Cyclin-like [Sesbania bispinosa]|nr:Cyclin-like [Sesbania bispinosa]
MAQPQQRSPSLLCDEEQLTFEEEDSGESDPHVSKPPTLPITLLEEGHDDLLSLISKEKSTHFYFTTNGTLTLLGGTHNDAVRWISRVSAFYGFSASTTVLAVNYFGRFVTSLSFQWDKPWVTQLTAVACVSLAAKMEETHVPLLLELQVAESEFLFQPKTIQRMELLVLSTLEWRMNPVTPISFFHHCVRRLGLKSPLHWEFLSSCEQVLLCVIADSKVMSYLPSTLAAAIMIHVIKEIEQFNTPEYKNQLANLLRVCEEEVNGCYKFMVKRLVCDEGVRNLGQKRKRLSEPSSPGGVIDACFSCESSNSNESSLSLEELVSERASRDDLNSPR